MAGKERSIQRAISVSQLESMKFKELPFDGEFLKLIGCPEVAGSWLIWGDSGNGKTRFALQLAKYLAQWCRVAYNSLEEGASKSMKKAFAEVGMDEVRRKVILLDNEPISELKERLKMRRSPDVVVIDSLQYSGLNYRDYVALRTEFKNKLFILISHADGKNPAGQTAKSIRYDAFVKIRIEGYKAYALSRFGGGEPYTIWDEGSALYYNDDL